MPKSLHKFAQPRLIWWAFGLAMVLLIFSNLLATMFHSWTGGYGLLDLGGGANAFSAKTSVTPALAYELIGNYGTQRSNHLWLILPDMLLPIGVWLFFGLTLLWLTREQAGWQRWLPCLASLYLLGDYSENICEALMLSQYPSQLPNVASLWTASFMLKNISIGLNSIAIVLLLGWRWRQAKQN
ncbi:hypothetical protein [Herpetosiphon giganteus]|uniref:hypothetical protein n=1 Tax=Herpetosiphon giganteus TaxID=2029754 RepID=UPI001956369B|nr:hypothetical protein [Herpetosiphon giganteus]MBM7841430.1 hypothetical protein [Herpetosiphon giganteus]